MRLLAIGEANWVAGGQEVDCPPPPSPPPPPSSVTPPNGGGPIIPDYPEPNIPTPHNPDWTPESVLEMPGSGTSNGGSVAGPVWEPDPCIDPDYLCC